ncbi:MAG: hypothetical protein ACKVT2_03115 [Saprospiraceae bacterium]
MNQKNIFTGIAAVLALQGILFYFLGEKMTSESFPNIDPNCVFPAYTIMKVLSCVSFALGLITYTVRNSPQVLWAYTIGIGLMSLNTLNDLLDERLNVPIVAIVIQVGIVLLSGYLWYQNSQKK